MALTPPAVPELEQFIGGETFPTDEYVHVESTLQQATDALWLTTRWEDYPTDPRMERITKYAIFDLTSWLLTQSEHRDEINSPFSSERLGSYSYQKTQAASKDGSSGIFWLDLLFDTLRDPVGDDGSWSTSEMVFNPGGLTYAEQRAYEKITLPDPSEPWGF